MTKDKTGLWEHRATLLLLLRKLDQSKWLIVTSLIRPSVHACSLHWMALGPLHTDDPSEVLPNFTLVLSDVAIPTSNVTLVYETYSRTRSGVISLVLCRERLISALTPLNTQLVQPKLYITLPYHRDSQ